MIGKEPGSANEGDRTAGEAAEIRIRPVAAGDFDALRSLYRDVWKGERDVRYDRMRFHEPYHDLGPVGSVADTGSELAAFYMIWPVQLTDGSRVVTGGQSIDTMTGNAFQGRGLFTRLARQCYRQCADQGMSILYGAPNKESAPGFERRLSWAAPTTIRTLVRPLSATGAMPLASVANAVLRAWPSGRRSRARIVHDRPSDADLAACLAANTPPRGTWRVHRTPRWYDFRYQPAGRFDYRWCCIHDGQSLAAFAIWALSLEAGGRLRRANLVDVIGPTAELRNAAVSAACTAAAAHANFISVVSTSAARQRELRAAGFVPVAKSPLIARTLDAESFDANPFQADGWDLIGGDFDFT